MHPTKAQLMLIATLETVLESGPEGAPGGALYSALMTAGITWDGFQQFQAILVDRGLVTIDGHHCWHPTPKALALKNQVQ